LLEEAIGVVGVLPPIERAGEEVDIMVSALLWDETNRNWQHTDLK
jgi:hypothetical protein